MMQTKIRFGHLTIWTQTMFPLGAKAGPLKKRIAKCSANHIIAQKVTDNLVSSSPYPCHISFYSSYNFLYCCEPMKISQATGLAVFHLLRRSRSSSRRFDNEGSLVDACIENETRLYKVFRPPEPRFEQLNRGTNSFFIT